MKIVLKNSLKNPEKLLLDVKTGLQLAGRPVGVVQGLVVISEEEKKVLINLARKIWQQLIKVSPNFIGLIRFDLVPSFSFPEVEVSSWKDMAAFDLGDLKITGVYEVNAHSPECAAAVSALHKVLPHLREYQPKVCDLLVQAIKKTFGNEKIIFVRGEGPVKKAWGDVFFENLRKAGLNIISMKPEEVVSTSPPLLWRWGDVCFGQGHSEYHRGFENWLRSYSYKGTVFNTIPISGDPSDKSLLLGDTLVELVGRGRLLRQETLEWGIREQENLVCKPLRGSSGNGIKFGRKEKSATWVKILQESLVTGGYGLFEARWLPKVILPGVGEFALDVNPAFWVNGSSLQYLYTVVRIDHWWRYWQRGTINVAQGAGFAGSVIED